MERQLNDCGVNPIVACIILIAGFIFYSIYVFSTAPYPHYIYALSAIGIIGTLGTKDRNIFLKIVFNAKVYQIIRILENSLLVLPFVIFLTVKTEFLVAVALFIIVGIMALINYNRNIDIVIPAVFFKTPFEFIIGFRKSLLVIIACYFIIFMAIRYDNFGLAVFAMLILLFTCTSFYFIPENVFYVWIFNSSPKQFLLQKMKIAFLHTLILSLPVLMCIGFFFQDKLWVVLLIEIAGVLLIITALLSKYAQFPTAISPAKLLALVFSAWFPPMIIAFAIVFYFQSNRSLKNILA